MSLLRRVEQADAAKQLLQKILERLDAEGDLNAMVETILSSEEIKFPSDQVAESVRQSPKDFLTRAILTRTPSTSRFQPQKPTTENPMPPISDFVAFKRYMYNRILLEMDVLHESDPQKLRQVVRYQIRDILTAILAENNILISKREHEKVYDALVADIIGVGPLEALWSDESITEILVLGAKNVHVKRDGGWEKTEMVFDNNDHILRILDRMTAPLGKAKSLGVAAMVSVELADASYLTAFESPLATNGTSLVLRKWKRIPRTPEAVLEQGIMIDSGLTFLEAGVRSGLNIVISSNDNQGALSLLNVLGSYIPNEAFIVMIEETAKLQLAQDKVLSLQSYGIFSTRYEANMRRLINHALTMQPDYFIIDRLQWVAVRDLLNNPAPFITTLNSSSPYGAVDNLYALYKKSETQLSPQVIQQQIASNVHLIVHIEQLHSGLRRVTSINEVMENDGSVAINPLFEYDKLAHGATLQQVGTLSSRLRHRLTHQPLEERLQIQVEKLLPTD